MCRFMRLYRQPGPRPTAGGANARADIRPHRALRSPEGHVTGARVCAKRLAYLPAEKEPVLFGVHSEVASHYGVPSDAFEPRNHA
jgi:hypothetical protein